MTVSEYMQSLRKPIRELLDVCNMHCSGCAMAKNGDKPCPMRQLMDIETALQYALDTKACNITEDTDMDTAQVTIYLRRAVVNGRSVRTLRYCSDEYIQQRNLIKVSDVKC